MLAAVCVEHEDLERWLQKHLLKSDQVVIGSTTNAWQVYDLLAAWKDQSLVLFPNFPNCLLTSRYIRL